VIEDIRDSIADEIRNRGLTQREVSEKAGYSNSILSGFISGRYDLRLQSLENICQALDLDIIAVPRNQNIRRLNIEHRISVHKGHYLGAVEVESPSGRYVKYTDIAGVIDER
jgi:transcriptional regulator with XRE-family HTH domain